MNREFITEQAWIECLVIIVDLPLIITSDIAIPSNAIDDRLTTSALPSIGNLSRKGNADYNQEEQYYLISAGSAEHKNNRDDVHFLYKKIEGDFILTADFSIDPNNASTENEFGWMVRTSLAPDSKQFSVCRNDKGIMYMK